MPYVHQDRPSCVCDTECFIDYWAIAFKSIEDGRTKVFELFEGNPLDKRGIATIFRNWRVIGFNSIKYDLPMILYAMSGASNEDLKKASDELIQYGTPHWVFMERMGLTVPDFIDHVDLMQVSPGAPQMPSLKIYSGRMHSRKMQELPIEHDESIDDVKRQVLRAYHGNDLDVTIDMARELKAQLDLRTHMSREYGVDLRSKSDAQIAEAVIKSEIEKALGRRVYAPDVHPGTFFYKVPDYLAFETAPLREMLDKIRRTKIHVIYNGNVECPELKSLTVEINGKPYQMGLGGLHSKESSISHYSDARVVLLDRDVTSYYPNSILLQGMYPKQLGPVFLKVYERIYHRRIAAKKGGDKNTAESLKVTLNGAFGKLGSPYSILYAPDLMVQVTLTGQLAILMLIERLELAGIEVISANTDGIVSKVPRDMIDVFRAVFFDWECDTGYATEETEYKSIHSQSVNSYIALKPGKGGKVEAKIKGPLGPSGPGLPGAAGLKKNPDMDVCAEAVVEYLKNGTPVEETIEWCTDVRKFLVVQRVTGGAVKDGEPLGKALRFYFAKGVSGGFHRKDSGNSVPKTIGAKLMMELQPALPADLDYDYYVREAYAILQDLGVATIDPRLRGRTGRFYGQLPDAKGIHIVQAETGVAICGKTRSSIRDSWIEHPRMPDGMRMCPKCKKA